MRGVFITRMKISAQRRFELDGSGLARRDEIGHADGCRARLALTGQFLVGCPDRLGDQDTAFLEECVVAHTVPAHWQTMVLIHFPKLFGIEPCFAPRHILAGRRC
jgi:hypothetical protein